MAAPVPQEGGIIGIPMICSRIYNFDRTPYSRGGHQVRDRSSLITMLGTKAPISSIRNRLTVLKRDRGEYIKPSDVNSLYQAVVKQGPSRIKLITIV